jgi:hypothetical protein
MTTVIASFRTTLLQICLLLATSCSATNTNEQITLVGGTPGEEPIKQMLSIPTGTNVDFIKWHLELDNKSAFVLDIIYGESQPNTLGFKAGGQTKSIKGTYLVTKKEETSRFKEVYQLTSDDLPGNITLVKINENVFHVLTLQHQLMVGNGGWSYSLSRKAPVDPGQILISSPVPDNKSLQLVFDGRTPCQEIATAHPEMKASPSCFKLKWRLILNRDSITHLPTTCMIRNIVDNEPRDIQGKWEIVKGTATNPDALIYKVVVGNLADPILLLVGDEHVLFFLDKNYQPLTGNEDFGFALNKKI